MSIPSDNTLNWRVESVTMYLFSGDWFRVSIIKTGAGQPGDDDPERITYLTDTPPRVGAVVRLSVTEVDR